MAQYHRRRRLAVLVDNGMKLVTTTHHPIAIWIRQYATAHDMTTSIDKDLFSIYMQYGVSHIWNHRGCPEDAVTRIVYGPQKQEVKLPAWVTVA